MAPRELKFHTHDEARTLIQMAKEFHQGTRPLPPEIVLKKQQIAAATRNAELFMGRLGQVAQDMIDDIVRMRLELDGLYSAWVVSETKKAS